MLSRPKLYSRIIIATSLIVGVIIVVASRSKLAEKIGIDIFVDVVLYMCTALMGGFFLRKQWHGWKLLTRLLVLLLVIWFVLMAVTTVTKNWPRLPWIRTEAFTAADEFMTDLKTEDYNAAMMKLTPRMQKCVSQNDLNGSSTRPVAWELLEMDEFSNILGTTMFTDGQEMSMMIRMVWLDGRWQINGFGFGMWPEERLDFLDMHCGK